MPAGATITVGPEHADFTGADNAAIQQAVDAAAAQGGGVVRILPGTYEMADSLHLRSGVHVRGGGEGTVLRKAAMVESELAADLGYGHYDLSLAEPGKFRVGMGVYVFDDNAHGFYTTVGTLTWQRGERLGISSMLNHDYSRRRHAKVQSLFPIVSGSRVEDVSVEDLVVDGNGAANGLLNGCRGGGVFLIMSSRVSLKRVTVRDFNGDGISFQQTRDVHVEGCTCQGNSGHGLHPGSGSVRPIMRDCLCEANGRDGIFYCLRVSYSLTEGCTCRRNGGVGISVGGRDTDHIIGDCVVAENADSGIFFREGDAAMGGHRCRLESNRLERNCQATGRGEICINGATRDVHILDNTIEANAEAAEPAGLVVGPDASRIVVAGNRFGPAGVEEIVALGDASAVSLEQPAEALAVGPDAAPGEAAWHLEERSPRG